MSWQPDGLQPTGWQPEGWQPGGEVEYPEIPDRCRITLPSGGVWIVDPDAEEYCEIDWSGVLSTGVSLVSVAYTLPAGLSNNGAALDTVSGKSALRVDGTAHGKLYAVTAVATLSAGSPLTFVAPLRCFNA